jgi:hypothetical protein
MLYKETQNVVGVVKDPNISCKTYYLLLFSVKTNSYYRSVSQKKFSLDFFITEEILMFIVPILLSPLPQDIQQNWKESELLIFPFG